MKKVLLMLLTLILISFVAGCGGNTGNNGNNGDDGGKNPEGYYYKWANGISGLACVTPKNTYNSIVYADEVAAYLGSEVPPFAAIDDGGRQSGILLIFTYYNKIQVESICTCNPDDGEIKAHDLNGDNSRMIPAFTAKKQGLFHVTATYENESLDIPVRVYHFSSVDLNNSDLDTDGIPDIKDLKALYGYQIVNSRSLSLILIAPDGGYSAADLTEFLYDKIYIIKTSSGKFYKILPTGTCGEKQYNSMNTGSDENGNFPY